MQQSVLTLFFVILFAAAQASDAEARFNRAIALQQEGKLAEAADEYRAALKIRPAYLEAHANLGVVLARLGRYEEAVASYESALKLAPQLLPILLNLGIAHYRAGQFPKAIDVFERYLQKKPETVQARQLHGLSLAAMGRDEEAIAQIEQTLAAAPPDAAVLYALGLSQLRAAKPGFRATLERLASFPQGLPALHMLQGQAFFRDREFEQALEELKEAEKLNPDLPRLHYVLGSTCLQLGRNKEAIAAFEIALRRAPEDAPTLYQLAYALEADGNLEAARGRVDESLRLAPDSPESNALAGRILFKLGKPGEALKPLEFAAARRSADHELRFTLARVYQRLGRKDDAAREFAEVQRLKAEQLKKDRGNTPKP
ncbi:MAG: tetratricopeptide repeat protein [Blastocatellia bacterium]|nr:tetratricopeptide repeat protein [Blastocatellia bacterium]